MASSDQTDLGTDMKRAILALLLVCLPVATSIDPGWRMASALAETAQVSAKDAFEAARELGTIDAWNAFLANYPTGFYADLARAYIKKLLAGGDVPPPTAAPGPTATPAPDTTPAPPASAPAATPAPATAPGGGKPAAVATPNPAAIAPTRPGFPAVSRGGLYMGFPERFNRYYTDPAWKPSRIIYVSANGSGDGTSRSAPMSVQAAIKAARPGTQLQFVPGNYQGCFELTKANSGSYDEPVVLYAERNEDQSIGVRITCCSSGRQTCINLENADYVAVDGFELIGGRFGVRAVGAGYPASQHSRGIAVIGNNAHDQQNDPLFSGQVDWAVWEGNVAYGAGKGDGHGIYLSNGGDWNIVRFNETFSNVSSDFQVNPDPAVTCKEVGVPFNDPRCDAYAGTGEGGQGASDYFLIDSNFFHHGAGNGPGANFTSLRRSVIRNNIFGFYPRHGVSFWQETDNPRLGSSENRIVHNLFITANGRQAVQFINHSNRNEFANNVILGVRVSGSQVTANPGATLMEVDNTVANNIYRGNVYTAGKIEGRSPNAQETVLPEFSPGWFANFPTALNRDPNDFRPTARAPFLGIGMPSPLGPSDRFGTPRSGKADPGPIQSR
jgi:hypothetical protein